MTMPEDYKLPHDMKFGVVTFRKGISLSLVEGKLQWYYDLVSELNAENETLKERLEVLEREIQGTQLEQAKGKIK